MRRTEDARRHSAAREKPRGDSSRIRIGSEREMQMNRTEARVGQRWRQESKGREEGAGESQRDGQKGGCRPELAQQQWQWQ